MSNEAKQSSLEATRSVQSVDIEPYSVWTCSLSSGERELGTGIIVQLDCDDDELPSLLPCLGTKLSNQNIDLETNYALLTCHSNLDVVREGEAKLFNLKGLQASVRDNDDIALEDCVSCAVSCCGPNSMLMLSKDAPAGYTLLPHTSGPCPIGYDFVFLFLNKQFKPGEIISPPVVNVSQCLNLDGLRNVLERQSVAQARNIATINLYSCQNSLFNMVPVKVKYSKEHGVVKRFCDEIDWYSEHQHLSYSPANHSPDSQSFHGAPIICKHEGRRYLMGISAGEQVVTLYGICQFLAGGPVPLFAAMKHSAPRTLFPNRWSDHILTHLATTTLKKGYLLEIFHLLVKNEEDALVNLIVRDTMNVSVSAMKILTEIFEKFSGPEELDEIMRENPPSNEVDFKECILRVCRKLKAFMKHFSSVQRGENTQKILESVFHCTVTMLIWSEQYPEVAELLLSKENIESATNAADIYHNSPDITSRFRIIRQSCDRASIVQHPQDTIAIIGQTATFTCRVHNIPPPSVEWTHQDTPLLPSEKIAFENTASIFKLTLSDVERKNEGKYCCKVSNSEGVVTKSNLAVLSIYTSDIIKLLEPLAVQWHQLGISLGLSESIIHKIKSEHGTNRACLDAVLCEKFKSSGSISNWQNELVQSVASQDGGNDPAIAKELTIGFRKDEEEKDLQEFENMKLKGDLLNQTIIQCMFFGFPGAGKSSLMNRLIGLPPNPNLFSTPVAEASIQVCMSKMSTTTIILSDKADCASYEWHVLPPCGEAQILLSKAKQEADTHVNLQEHQEQTVEEADMSVQDMPNYEPVAMETADAAPPNSTPDSSSREESPLPFTTDEEYIASLGTTSEEHPPTLRKVFEDAVRHENLDKIKDFVKRGIVTLYLTDTGGQTEFQELLPALVAGHFIIFLVFDLRLDLNETFTVEYRHPDGRKGKPYKSIYTVKDTLLRSLASIACMFRKDSSHNLPKLNIVFVGTHKDRLDSPAERISQINDELHSLVKKTRAYKLDLIQTDPDDSDKLLICVDNMSEDDADFRPIKKLVGNISKAGNFTVTARSTWLIFCFYVRRLPIKVITFEECYKIAKMCGIKSRDELKQALFFLHKKLGLVRYFQEKGLENIVIIDPQILFDKITTLVTEMFTFGTLRIKDEFRDQGIFPIKCLNDISWKDTDELSVAEFLKLLNHLHITAPLQTGSAIFMPCVLARFNPQITEASQPLSKHDPPPLLVTFKGGYCPIGLFCFLSAYLISSGKQSWVFLHTEIFKFSLSFRVDDTNVLTLAFRPTYLEVLMTSSTGKYGSLQKTCVDVKNYIDITIEQVKSFLNYINTQDAAHDFTFYCTHPQCEGKKQHPATLKIITHSNKNCANSYCEERPCPKPPRNWQYWFDWGEIEDSSSHDLNPQPKPLTDPPKYEDLMEEVAAQLPRKWADVATKLGLKPDEIERIEVLPNATPNRCYREIFSVWKKNIPKPYRWATIVESLNSQLVDEHGLASSIENRIQ